MKDKDDYDKADKEHSSSWAARDLGQTWKVNPRVFITKGETLTIAEMEEFLKANSGLKSRFANIIHFDDYTGEEITFENKEVAGVHLRME